MEKTVHFPRTFTFCGGVVGKPELSNQAGLKLKPLMLSQSGLKVKQLKECMENSLNHTAVTWSDYNTSFFLCRTQP